ncbi:MAG: bifunctional DNA-formamidopyrimidine glycosylase/DNA-(apurinic or apyrimidinic site) lyase [Ferrimicrobium sp.]|jgi:formamidopyrimidine-DNA glycosylase|uniref:Bifunctional DNA-formamidopyrimidine glycosylase/DNA-(Apurinic or apyrimidinic site) lyase n=1 Tax=Ferrimicrobium acidiphilum TaxID=121039 RepID=A0ABV3Y5A4_9ACTN|nr:bifunctional DNA-formamidopyrimidine glycosylase/DNA-(apurinic or apyrimidinic site) lyase [Ferrimicrobium sp.]
MPELPEVETIRRQLEPRVGGLVIESVLVTGARVLRRGNVEALRTWVPRRVTGVDRIGKFLALRLDGGAAIVVHLGMAGHLRVVPGVPSVAHTQLSLAFEGGWSLLLVDPRTFGEVFYADTWLGSPPYTQALSHLGIDLLCDPARVIDWVSPHFVRARRSVKAFIMDQKMMAGLGNMYADEALYRVGIHPDERCQRLGDPGLCVLIEGVQRVLSEAIADGGSTFADRSYRNLEGEGGYYPSLLVYQRHGRRCLLCYREIERLRFQRRYSHLCPSCQRRL